MGVPFYSHLVFISRLFVAGIAAHLPALVLISITMTVMGLMAHAWLLQQRTFAQGPSLRSSSSSAST
jgi:hypothetical protein